MEATLGNTVYTGIVGGVLGLVLSPILCGLIWAWFAIVSFLPFKLALKMLKRINLNVLMEENEHSSPIFNQKDTLM